MRIQPFSFRLAGVCPAGHETEIFAARMDPLDNSTIAAAEAAIPPSGIVGKCSECGAPCATVRTAVDGEIVSEIGIEEFNQRAVGKAPPRNYG